jgi:hypothetical protein
LYIEDNIYLTLNLLNNLLACKHNFIVIHLIIDPLRLLF